MAMDVADDKVQNLFDKLQTQRTILDTCTDLYKTLTSQFTSIHQFIAIKSQTLHSRLLYLDSNSPKTLEDLQRREDSIPDRFSSLSSIVDSHKQVVLPEFEKPAPGEDAPLADALKSVCRRMDHSGLLKLAVSRRKESVLMRAEMPSALAECVDPPRLLLDTVREFVQQKAAKKGGLTDKRRACATVVVGMFPPEELVEKKGGEGPEFSKAMVEMAEAVVREWRETAEKIAAAGADKGAGSGDNGEGSSGMGPAEASMFLQIILGFGLKDKFEEEFYRMMVVEFAARRDMPKLAIALFRDRIGDIIDELVKNGKQVEAVYFATVCGLTERFQPVPLLKAYLQNSKKNASDILKKGNHTHAALDEANTYEKNSLKFIIKCVEDHNIESEFPLESLRKRLAILEKAKTEKKALTSAPRPSNKRGYGSGAGRNSGSPLNRPAKMTKFSGPYPSFGQRNQVLPAQQSSVSRYPPPYNNYPTYDAGRTTLTYGPSYGGSHIPPSAQAATQLHYGVPGDGVGGVGAQLGGPYGGQVGYGSYDYGATAPSTYKPSSYT